MGGVNRSETWNSSLRYNTSSFVKQKPQERREQLIETVIEELKELERESLKGYTLPKLNESAGGELVRKTLFLFFSSPVRSPFSFSTL